MNNELIFNFKKSQPLIWYCLSAKELKIIKKIKPEKLEKYLTEIVKDSSDSKKISFVFRFIPSIQNFPNHDAFILKGINLLNNSKSIRIKSSVLYYLTKVNLNNFHSFLLTNTFAALILDNTNNFQLAFMALVLLKNIDADRFLKVCGKILLIDETKMIFHKKKVASLLMDMHLNNKYATEMLEQLFNENIPFVQKGIAENLHLLNNHNEILKWLNRIYSESENGVICTAIRSILSVHVSDGNFKAILNILKKTNTEVQLFSIETLTEFFIRLKKSDKERFFILLEAAVPLMEELFEKTSNDSVCKALKLSLERLWIETNDSASEIFLKLKNLLKKKRRTKKIEIPLHLISSCNEETLGRVLAVIAQEDFCIQLIKSVFGKFYLVKDAFFKFRLWRFLHELRHSSTSKRQSWKNTVGRHFIGRNRAASSILAEQAKTDVPGENILNDSIPASIPMIDDFISASESSEDYKIFSPEGITIIKPPESIFKKLYAELNVAWNFNKLSNLRNSAENSYICSFRKLGFQVNIVPYSSDKIFSSLPGRLSKKLFSVSFVFPSMLNSYIDDLKTYFISLYSNSIRELALFLSAFIACFIVRHLIVNALYKYYRTSFLLCIGGWGTRGKSSVERMKTALFAYQGCNVISKTTGSEAAFTYSVNNEKPISVPIFRPYGKATIWEQLKFTRLASKVNAEIFLWECMAISPKYVKIMQHSWLHDNYSTITNTYPDHEDHQGPAGWNVAETMANFVPDKGMLLTTETQMYPFLKDECEKNNSSFVKISGNENVLITSDILGLFPYKEHPSNISLVLKLANELGIDGDVALKGIIDTVKPDIGALKEYNPVIANGKKITFISGMSANEKTACIYNWNALQMNTFQKNTLRAVLINNRADRPSRSKIFADLIANAELDCDKYFLIGSNLDSFLSHVRKLCHNKEELLKKFVVIHDYHIHPAKLFELFESHIPEGWSMKIMGIQNIKGVGINICRWLENPDDYCSCARRTRYFAFITDFFDPIFMIFKKSRANSIYRSLVKGKVSPAYAIKKLDELSS
ncbi:MAG: poly-gamma-glutamate synthase PgsB [Lentisphaerae bacterium GWF2_38_69]|nr:MAG: poly-gamma-glutamate synthase PgsB [Lentisphaerae bacterium GWF2_38_69]